MKVSSSQMREGERSWSVDSVGEAVHDLNASVGSSTGSRAPGSGDVLGENMLTGPNVGESGRT